MRDFHYFSARRARRYLLPALASALALGACGENEEQSQASEDGGMTSMSVDAPRLPPMQGFYDGEEITFVHPEASAPLPDMMGSPVIVVPELAKTPDDATADLYGFRNGVRGNGPFGFQGDVLDSAPGDDNYSPLRTLYNVSWKPDADPRVLQSVDEVMEAERAGELTIEKTNTVINSPFLTWPGGSR